MPEKDRTISKLLEDSKDMVRRFELLSGTDWGDQISADVQKDTLENLGEALEPAADALFDLFLEEDAMSVTAEFRPPAGGGKPLDLETIEQGFAAKEVLNGILWEEIRNALEDCNLGLKMRTGVVIARGTPAIPSVPEHVRMEDRWTAAPLHTTDTGHAVDFKAISPFVLVEQGDLLARRVPEAYGSHGTDVRGQPIPFPTQKRTDWIPGENVVDTPVGFEAALDGRLILDEPRFSVSPILELAGVDYKTGNIQFKGEVIIHGKVSSGFAVEAGGGITGQETLDAFQMKAKGDITTPGGIIGNGAGRVEAGGRVSAKFLEHLYLLAQGDVHAEICVLNSILKTRGSLRLGDKGILAGGQVHALHGIDLYQIGTATGPRTELFLGLDFQGMEEIIWIRERSREVHAQLRKLDAAIPYGGNRVAELMLAAKKLRQEIVQLTEAARTQLLNLEQDENASVTVRGTVFPGTSVEICHVQFLVNQKMSKVRFYLDKRKGVIGVGGLSTETATPSAPSRKKR